MFNIFKRYKDNPILPDRVADVVNFKYDLNLIKEQLELIKAYILDKQLKDLSFWFEKVNFNKLERLIEKELDYDRPSFGIELPELNLEIMINSNICRNVEKSTFTVTFDQNKQSTYLDEILAPKNYISRFLNNEEFYSRQGQHQIIFFSNDGYKNKRIYPGFNPKTEIIDLEKNPGRSLALDKYGVFSISYQNEYNMDLLTAISKEKVINALKKLDVQYEMNNQYIKFKLFENHRESEFIKNFERLESFAKMINSKNFTDNNLYNLT